MRKTLAVILGLLLWGANQLPARGFHQARPESVSAGPETSELVLVGTVTKLYPLATSRQRRAWAVVAHVDNVVKGEYSGATFTFSVHSPALAGLQVNRTYVIKATRVDGRYVVNEFTLEEGRARKKP